MGSSVEWKVFRAGKYPQGDVSVADLDEIIAGYDPSVHEAPVVLDHPIPGLSHRGPAFGWVETIRREGGELFATIREVSEELKSLIEEGRYRYPSIEVYEDFQGNGKKYFKAVALLGANTPAVKGLGPVTYKEDGGPSAAYVFEESLTRKEEKTMGTFTQKQLDQMIEAAVTKAEERIKAEVTKQFEEKLEDKDKEVKTFGEKAKAAEKKAADAESELATQKAEAEKQEVKSFCDGLVRDGRIKPADSEGLQARLLALPNDESNVVKFGDKELTQRAALMEEYETRAKFSSVPQGEIVKEPGEKGEYVTFGEGDEQFRAPKSVVQAYHEAEADYMKMGVSLEDFARSEAHHAA